MNIPKSQTKQSPLPKKLELVFNAFIDTTGLITTGTTLTRIVMPILECSSKLLGGKASFIILEDKKHLKFIYQDQSHESRVLDIDDRQKKVLLKTIKKIPKKPSVLPLEKTGLDVIEPLKKLGKSSAMVISRLRTGFSLGLLGVVISPQDDVSAEDLNLFRVLSRQTGVALRNAKQFERTQILSITDGLTGAYNYRFLIDAGKKEIGRADRFGEQFSLIMIDIDGLKDYNDVHGHLKGSGVIKQLAKIASKCLRRIDLLCKYGGDEFVVIQPRTSKAGAACAAERIRMAIMKHRFPGERATGKITASMGIATYPEDGKTIQKLIESADKALYKAKTHGRNQIWLAGRKRPYSKG